MPVIKLGLIKMSKEKKAQLVKEVTKITPEITGLPPGNSTRELKTVNKK